jgi:hypothetical protein
MRDITDGFGRKAPVAVAVVLWALLLPVGAAAQPPEERGADRGRRPDPRNAPASLFEAVEAGDAECGDLDASDFVAIGEFLIGRMHGSPAAHEAMDRMMSASGLDDMHEQMGRRLAGCGGAVGGMMGMMGASGGMMGGDGGGMMDERYGGGSVASGYGYDDQDDDVEPWMAIAVLLALIAVAAGAFVFARPGTHRSTPLDLLNERFARGEIDADDYRERVSLLGGGNR